MRGFPSGPGTAGYPSEDSSRLTPVIIAPSDDPPSKLRRSRSTLYTLSGSATKDWALLAGTRCLIPIGGPLSSQWAGTCASAEDPPDTARSAPTLHEGVRLPVSLSAP